MLNLGNLLSDHGSCLWRLLHDISKLIDSGCVCKLSFSNLSLRWLSDLISDRESIVHHHLSGCLKALVHDVSVLLILTRLDDALNLLTSECDIVASLSTNSQASGVRT